MAYGDEHAAHGHILGRAAFGGAQADDDALVVAQNLVHGAVPFEGNLAGLFLFKQLVLQIFSPHSRSRR